jgi:hypothetical protein
VGASDSQGNIAAAWVSSASGQFTDEATGLVVGAPTISNVTFPATATQDARFTYAAPVTDRWVSPTSTWNFGDNSTGPLSGSKSYTGTGSFTAVLTATDPFGNSTSASRSIAVAPPAATPAAGGAAGGSGASGSPGPTARIAVSNLRQSARVWREGNNLAKFAAKHKSPVGTTFTFTLNLAGTVKLSFTRPGSGRLAAGGRCLAPNRRSRKRLACALVAGTVTHPAHAGVNKVTFQGRVSRGTRLAPGSYVLVLTAIGANGQASTPQTIAFTIARG